MAVAIKRVYLSPEKDDGKRILVDRLWPRGISKDKAHIALWLKDIAPSDDLRQWFHHDPDKWLEFKKKYVHELRDNKEVIQQLLEELKKGKVTFVYAARDEKHNNAVVLKEFVDNEDF